MRYLLASSLFAMVAACSDGAQAPEEIERICAAATECGALPASETDRCVTELDAATPDSASRAVAECATCMDTMTCGSVSSGKCREACEPFFATINSVAGKATGACTSTTTGNFAIKSDLGNMMIRLDCPQGDVQIIPGPYFDVGTTKPCGKLTGFFGGLDCPAAAGTISITQRDGRRWVTGSCSCANQSLSFEVPFRISF